MDIAEDKSEATPPKRQKLNEHSNDFTDDRPMCMYGSSCYRRSPDHQKEFKHRPRKMSPSELNLPPCKNGANCSDRNLLHFALYFHPTSSTSGNHNQLGSLKEEFGSKSNDVSSCSSELRGTNGTPSSEFSENSCSNKKCSPEVEQNEVMIEKRVNNLEKPLDRFVVLHRIFTGSFRVIFILPPCLLCVPAIWFLVNSTHAPLPTCPTSRSTHSTLIFDDKNLHFNANILQYLMFLPLPPGPFSFAPCPHQLEVRPLDK